MRITFCYFWRQIYFPAENILICPSIKVASFARICHHRNILTHIYTGDCFKGDTGQVLNDTGSVEVIEVIALVDRAFALLVFPDICLPEAGLAVLHVLLVAIHSRGGVVHIVMPVREKS